MPTPEIMFQVMSHTTTSTHTGASHDHCAAIDLVNRHRLGSFTGEVQARQLKRIMTAA